MPIQEFSGNAPETQLASSITAASSSIVVDNGTGYPTGATGNFVITLGRETATEEKVLCSSRSTNTFTVAAGGRGYDGSTAAAHDADTTVNHTISAVVMTDIMRHIYDSTHDDHSQYASDAEAILDSLVDAKGDLIVGSAADTVTRLAVGTDGQLVVAASGEATGLKYAALDDVQVFGREGTIAVTTGVMRFRFPFAATLLGVSAAIGTAPTGASVIVDVHKNGTTVYTTQANRPTIAAAANAASETVPDVTAVASGDYITVDIDQIGSTVAGANLTVAVRYRRTL